MNEKEESFFSKNKNFLLASAAASSLGLLWFLYNRKSKNVKEIPTIKKKVKEQYGSQDSSASLKEYNKEFYPIYIMIAREIQRIHQSVAKQTGIDQLTPEHKDRIKNVFVSQTPWITKEIENIEKKILNSYKFYDYFDKNRYEHKDAENREILNLRKQIDDALDNAFDGILPVMDPTIVPDTFTIEDVLGIYRHTITLNLKIITNEAIKIKEAGGNCTGTNMDYGFE